MGGKVYQHVVFVSTLDTKTVTFRFAPRPRVDYGRSFVSRFKHEIWIVGGIH